MIDYFLTGRYVADTRAQRELFGDVPTVEDSLHRYAADSGLIEAAPARPPSGTRPDEITCCERLAHYRLWRDLPREFGEYKEWAPALLDGAPFGLGRHHRLRPSGAGCSRDRSQICCQGRRNSLQTAPSAPRRPLISSVGRPACGN
jgi:hypothetical protein